MVIYSRVDQHKVLTETAALQDEMLGLAEGFVELRDWHDAKRMWRIYGPPIYGVNESAAAEQRRFLAGGNYRSFFRSAREHDAEAFSSPRDEDQDWIAWVSKALDAGSNGNLKRATYDLRVASGCTQSYSFPGYLLGAALFAGGRRREARAAWVAATTQRVPSDGPGTGEINWRATRMLLAFY